MTSAVAQKVATEWSRYMEIITIFGTKNPSRDSRDRELIRGSGPGL